MYTGVFFWHRDVIPLDRNPVPALDLRRNTSLCQAGVVQLGFLGFLLAVQCGYVTALAPWDNTMDVWEKEIKKGKNKVQGSRCNPAETQVNSFPLAVLWEEGRQITAVPFEKATA